MDSIMNFLDFVLGKVVNINRWYSAQIQKNEMRVFGTLIVLLLLSIILVSKGMLFFLVCLFGLIRFYGLTQIGDRHSD